MQIPGLLNKAIIVLAGVFSVLTLSSQQSSSSFNQSSTLNRQQLGSAQTSSSPDRVKATRDTRASARKKVLRVGKSIHHTKLDCSHLVHDLYQRAGLTYEYVNSEQLYDGVPGFRQVEEPIAGDIIVWRGHMGVIVDPLMHSFLSSLRTGVRVTDYETDYWKNRGIPRFFRYTAGDDVIDLSRQVRVARNHITRGSVVGE